MGACYCGYAISEMDLTSMSLPLSGVSVPAHLHGAASIPTIAWGWLGVKSEDKKGPHKTNGSVGVVRLDPYALRKYGSHAG